MSKEIKVMRFSANSENALMLDTIVSECAELVAAAAYRDFGSHGIIEKTEIANYREKNEKVKTAMLAFAAQVAGISVPANATDFNYAMDTKAFRDTLNAITTRTLGAMMVRYENPQIGRLADIETIGVGESRSYEIEPKALPIAQRATYLSNVTVVPSYAKRSVTLSPKPYSLGVSLAYIYLLANGYDWGRAVAKVYAGMIFAQYELVINKIFNTQNLVGTPFLIQAFTPQAYVQAAEDLGMLNGGGSTNVLALGTLSAWQSVSALATQGGFTTKDEFIRTAFLQKIYGIDSMILDQFTNYAAPFTAANAQYLRAIPNDYILLISRTDDKVVKLVRENYVRAFETPASENNLNRNEFSFFQAFDAELATSSWYALQSTSQA